MTKQNTKVPAKKSPKVRKPAAAPKAAVGPYHPYRLPLRPAPVLPPDLVRRDLSSLLIAVIDLSGLVHGRFEATTVMVRDAHDHAASALEVIARVENELKTPSRTPAMDDDDPHSWLAIFQHDISAMLRSVYRMRAMIDDEDPDLHDAETICTAAKEHFADAAGVFVYINDLAAEMAPSRRQVRREAV